MTGSTMHDDTLGAPSDGRTTETSASPRSLPLAPIQRAYTIGRATDQPLGGVDCLSYFEFAGGSIDTAALQTRVDRLRRHPALRASMDLSAGLLRENDLTAPTVVVHDATASQQKADRVRRRVRDRLNRSVLDVEHGQAWAVEVTRAPHESIIHIVISLAVTDIHGVIRMIEELANDEELPRIGFAELGEKLAPPRKRRLHAVEEDSGPLPEPPDLCVAYDSVPGTRITRHRRRLDREHWERFGRLAARLGTSKPVLLLTLYETMLARWSTTDEFIVSLPGLDVRRSRGQIADRTRVHAIRAAVDPGRDLDEATTAVAGELRRRLLSGTSALDELREARAHGHSGMSPFVFTYNAEAPIFSPAVTRVLGRQEVTRSSTPQVALDAQVIQFDSDGVEISFDVRDGALRAGDRAGALMLDSFYESIVRVAELDPQRPWPSLDELVRLPAELEARREALNSTDPLPGRRLHELFMRHVEEEPRATALLWHDDGGAHEMSYGRLDEAARRIAHRLAPVTRPGELVGISLPKGPEQVMAVLGALYSGCAYLPLSVELPPARRRAIVSSARLGVTIDRGLVEAAMRADAPAGDPVRPTGPDDSAYAIYTSGSTGEPKGVLMSHAAAANTVQDVAGRLALGPRDRVLGVSSLDFDLSVFDIFGPLSTGGALVCIDEDERRDAFAWLRLVAEHRVTIWNSAPALAEMLCAAAGPDERLPLRACLCSGDWIDPGLGERMAGIAPGCVLAAMGGATEGGIWSNLHLVTGPDDLSRDWRAVPYGQPLRGQAYRVADRHGRDCPPGVAGELWIGGASLATGYLNRPELTAERFPTLDGRRWYRTGDLGMWDEDLLLHFLGRRDSQVKIRGHRIELGDVEQHLRSIDGVREAVVVPTADRTALIGMISPAGGHPVDPDRIVEALAERLPSFMLPRRIRTIDRMPLSANGKIDRGRAAAIALDDRERVGSPAPSGDSSAPPEDDDARRIGAAWSRVLGVPVTGDTDFFAVGGDSLDATRVCARLRADGYGVTVASLFTRPLLRDFVACCRRSAAPSEPSPDDAAPLGEEAFPLSPLQRGYALGMDGLPGTVRARTQYAVVLAGDGPIDGAAFADAVTALVHDCAALRCMREGDSMQRVRADAPVPVLTASGPLREDLERRRIGAGHVIEVVLPDGTATRCEEIGLLVDYLCLDAPSLSLLIGAISERLSGGPGRLGSSAEDFARFCTRLERAARDDGSSAAGRRLPDGPDVPAPGLSGQEVGFTSLRAALPRDCLAARRAAEQQVTLSAQVLAELGAALTAASGQESATITLPMQHRPDDAPETALGCFTRLGHFVCGPRPQPRASHRAIGEALSSTRTGVEAGATGRRSAFGVVFTSTLGLGASGRTGLRPVWSLTSTPGVLIDCQLTQGPGGAEVRWDHPRDTLDEDWLRAAFEDFCARIGARPESSGRHPRTGRSSVHRLLSAALEQLGDVDSAVVGAWRRATAGHGPADAPLDWQPQDALLLADCAAGRRPVEELLRSPRLSPVGLMRSHPRTGTILQGLIGEIRDDARSRNRPLVVVELGAVAKPSAMAALREQGVDALWVVVEPDDLLREQAAREGIDAVRRVPPLVADVVIGLGVLHRDRRLLHELAHVRRGPSSWALIAEPTELTAHGLVSAGLLDPGLLDGTALHDGSHWWMRLQQAGWSPRSARVLDDGLLVVRARAGADRADPPGTDGPAPLGAATAEQPPRPAQDDAGSPAAPRPGFEKTHAAALADATRLWRENLPLGEDPDPGTDFFAAGGDSLRATRVVRGLQALGWRRIRMVDVFTTTDLDEFATRMAESGREAAGGAPAGPDPTSAAYPLNAVQRAYLTGRDPEQLLGGVAAHCYFEYEAERLDPHRLETAVGALVARHPALRTVTRSTGNGPVATELPAADWPLVESSADPRDETLAEVTDPSAHGPLTVRVHEHGDGATIGIGMDNLMLDGASMMMALQQLGELYADPPEHVDPMPGPAAYRRAADQTDGPEIQRLDRRLDRLPAVPLLPSRDQLLGLRSPSFERVRAELDGRDWRAVVERAAELRVTPAAMTLAAYAAELAGLSGLDSVTVNVTRFDRDPALAGIEQVLGDFTSLRLIPCLDTGDPLPELARRVQTELADAADDPAADTTALQRRIVARTGDPTAAIHPIVFTCGLGLGAAGGTDVPDPRELGFASLRHARSQTPQVVLDLQVFAADDGLHLSADHVVQLVEPALARRLVEGVARRLVSLVDARRGPSRAPADELTRTVTEAWRAALGTEQVDPTTGFFAAGGDSLRATRCIRELHDRGLGQAGLRMLLASTDLAGFVELLRRAGAGQDGGHRTPPPLPDRADRPVTPDPGEARAAGAAGATSSEPAEGTPFPLTEVQTAYLVGRTGAYSDGGLGCTGYVEFDLDLAGLGIGDLRDQGERAAVMDRLTQAWDRVCAAHPMLRAVIGSDGTQSVRPGMQVPMQIELDPDDERGERLRRELSARQYQIDSDRPMMDIVARITDEGVVVHLSIDLLITDYTGIRSLLHDLDRALDHPDERIAPPSLSFAAYQRLRQARAATSGARAERERDLAWWRERMTRAPEPLRLAAPLERPEEGAVSRRRSHHLPGPAWEAFTAACTEHALTPSSVLLALLGAVGRRYGSQEESLVTVTAVQREQLAPDMARIVGDFTTAVLARVRCTHHLLEDARATQQEIFDALEHGSVSGLEASRMIGARDGDGARRARTVPVVFTSTVGASPLPGPRRLRVRPGSGISATPQVLLDVQITPAGDGVTVDWDSRVGGFDERLLDEAFADYCAAVDALCTGDRWPDGPALPQRAPQPVERVGRGSARLEGSVVLQADADPEAVALIDGSERLTRGELVQRANALATSLLHGGLGVGSPVMVRLGPGAGQIVAELGVLLAGGCFVPIDPQWPPARTAEISAALASAWGAAPLVVDDDAVQAACSPQAPPAAGAPSAVDAGPEETAYVIFTSGSTGTPKGVAISHEQALTTLSDIAGRLRLGPRDRVLAVSRHSFDLSVFNVFGVLGAGGAIVVPRCGQSADPQVWAEEIATNSVTLWNSVPAQLTMLLDEAGAAPSNPLGSIRAALVSGDWIPVDQPARLWSLVPGARFLALGGATEASIWSNLHEVAPGEHHERSIPYGRALSNQGLWVLNPDDEPTGVAQPGEIVLAGDGVGRGYIGVPATADGAFFTHPVAGERCYRTGDRGRLLPDGEVEFLGRLDEGQVKLNGHRIELGEVERALRLVPGVSDALAAVAGDEDRQGRFLVGAVVAESRADESDRLVGRALAASHEAARIDEQALRRLAALVNDTVHAVMAHHLARACHGPATVERIADALGASGRIDLLRRWVASLTGAGLASTAPDGTVSFGPTRPLESIWPQWDEVERLGREQHYGEKMLDYVGQCLRRMPGLLNGSVDALSLFFPQGRTDVAADSYQGNLVSTYLNGQCCAAITAMADRAVRDGRALRILEIGAGVGGTTAPVVEALGGRPYEYLFTDLSEFFLHDARRRWPQLRTAILDINDPRQIDALGKDFGKDFDVVLSANTLHNAVDIPASLRALHELLRPDGAMVVIESTAPLPALMASMEFKFKAGPSQIHDERRLTGSPFLTRDQWERVLGEIFAGVHSYPPRGHGLEAGAQSMFWAGVHRTGLDLEAVSAGAAERLTASMRPRRLVELPGIPLTANGKRDRRAVAGLATGPGGPTVDPGRRQGATGPGTRAPDGPTTAAQATTALPAPGNPPSAAPDASVAPSPTQDVTADPSERIRMVWREVLNLDPSSAIAEDSDFFALGGDSLLLARAVGQVRRALTDPETTTWDHVLRTVVDDPTPRGFLRAVTASGPGPRLPATPGPAVGQERPSAPVTTPVDGRGRPSTPTGPTVTTLVDGRGRQARGRPVLVLVHDGSGGLGPYEDLVEQLRADGSHEAIGLSRSTDDGYLRTPPERLFGELADRYAAEIAARGDRPVHLVGYCMGGLLATGTASRLLARGLDASVTVISSYRMPFTVGSELLMDFALARLLHREPAQAGIVLAEDELGRALTAAREAGNEVITDELLARHGDPSLREALARAPRTVDERLALLAADSDGQWSTDSLRGARQVFAQSMAAVAAWDEPAFLGRMRFIRQRGRIGFLPGLGADMTRFWQEQCLGELRIDEVEGNHFDCLSGPHAARIARLVIEESGS